MIQSKIRSGGCMCASVRYEITGPITDTVACYCKTCQRETGNFDVANGLKKSDIKIQGEENIKWYRSSEKVERGFCKNCGSSMFFQSDGSETISIGTGTLDDSSDLPIVYNIFVEEADGHCVLKEGVPNSIGYPENDPRYPTI